MKIARAALLSLMLSAGAAQAATPAPLAPVADVEALATLTGAASRSLQTARAIRGKFVQQRHLAGLSKPLESSGTFLFAREAGIEWHTLVPFDSQFLLTESGITQRDEGGETLRIEASDQPALTVVSRVFFALFSLDFTALSHDFEMRGARAATGWRLELTPRSEALRKVFRQAALTGDTAVQRVVLEEGSGDSSTIDLSAVEFDPKGPTPDERRRF